MSFRFPVPNLGKFLADASVGFLPKSFSGFGFRSLGFEFQVSIPTVLICCCVSCVSCVSCVWSDFTHFHIKHNKHNNISQYQYISITVYHDVTSTFDLLRPPFSGPLIYGFHVILICAPSVWIILSPSHSRKIVSFVLFFVYFSKYPIQKDTSSTIPRNGNYERQRER